jgi:hypothetical protein
MQTQSGTPFQGYVSLTNGAPGPVTFALFSPQGIAAMGGSFAAPMRLYVTSIVISSNDGTQALITVDSGGTTPTKLCSQYQSASQPPGVVHFDPGICRGIPGVVPRATASAVTSGKTVEVCIAGYISNT